jgi:hypothetical protein
VSAADLARVPALRLARPRAWPWIAAWPLLAIGAALALARAHAGSSGSAVGDVFGGVALPLLAYAVVGAALAGDGLPRSTRALVAFGAAPARVAGATILVAAVVSAALAAVTGAGVAALAHSTADAPLARDAAVTAWVAALGGASYAALFALGATFGRRGGGRAWALALDWLLGLGAGSGGTITPRAHVRSLLGGEAVAGLSDRASFLWLAVLAIVFALLATARSRRA